MNKRQKAYKKSVEEGKRAYKQQTGNDYEAYDVRQTVFENDIYDKYREPRESNGRGCGCGCLVTIGKLYVIFTIIYITYKIIMLFY